MKKLKYVLITERNALDETRYSAHFVTPWYRRNIHITLQRNNSWYNPYWSNNRAEVMCGIHEHARRVRGDAYEIVVKEAVEA